MTDACHQTPRIPTDLVIGIKSFGSCTRGVRRSPSGKSANGCRQECAEILGIATPAVVQIIAAELIVKRVFEIGLHAFKAKEQLMCDVAVLERASQLRLPDLVALIIDRACVVHDG